MSGSNRLPPACKAGALPSELIPRAIRNVDQSADCALGRVSAVRQVVRQQRMNWMPRGYPQHPV